MTNSVTIKCEAIDGRSLAELGKMIQRRSEVLGETTKDAVISSAINVLISLRSGTLDAKKNKRGVNAKITEQPGLRPSFTAGKVRCLRTSGGSRFDARRVRFITKGLPDSQLRVFKVEPSHLKVSPYFIVCDSPETALAFEQSAARHRIANYGTLAKWALGVAMNKLSTRNVSDWVSSLARNAGSRLANVMTEGGSGPSGNFAVSVSDGLDYSVSALRSGIAEVDVAFRKAANKTAGILNHHFHKLGKLDSDVDTPFPEVKRRSA